VLFVATGSCVSRAATRDHAHLKQVWPGCPRLVDHRCVIPNSYNMPRHAARQAMSSGSHFRDPQKSLTGSFCADTGSGYGTPRAMITISPRSDAVTKPKSCHHTTSGSFSLFNSCRSFICTDLLVKMSCASLPASDCLGEK